MLGRCNVSRNLKGQFEQQTSEACPTKHMVNIERTANAQSMGYNWRGSGERGDFVLISGLSERFEVDS